MSASEAGSPIDDLQQRIDGAMLRDRHRLRQTLKRLRGSREAHGKSLERWLRDLEASETICAKRRKRLPRVEFDETLPVCQRREEIAAAIRDHQVVIVCGETGSGKSTQLPKICLDLGRGVAGMIGHTQPRRIAARSIAARIADEMKTSLGTDVGFKVRFTDVTRPETYVKLMTDGVLLAELAHDRFFEQYDTIILDEAHERSLNIDFLIGCLRRLLPKRPELKLIITSATIDAARFAKHFATPRETPPVIEVTGRTYPIEIRHCPIERDEETGDSDWIAAVLDAADELARIDQGDMLVFMPTERDIHEMAKALRAHTLPRDPNRQTQILPLYARLPLKEQHRVFGTSPHRRIVIATNVAESSLTVPGIRYVIDLGTARISRYSARSGTQRLPIEPVSQASADQRAGRCGRIGPGVCVRLYSEQDYATRERFTPPEIRRSNLASVILRMKAHRLGEIERFPFLDPPRRDVIRDGYKTLFEIGALDDRQNLTELGRRLARLPADPRIGRIILAASEENCLNEILIIASALEVQDPRLRPVDHEQAADEAHREFQHEGSDFLTYLKLWDFYHGLKEKLSRSQIRKACQQNFLSYNRMREWLDVHRQLMELADEAGLELHKRSDDEGAIHRAILTGMLTRIAWRKEEYEYTTAGSGKANLWPGSGVFAKRPRWVVSAEIVETNRRYLRTCGRIDPEWVERLAAHLVKRSYSDPEWDEQSASAVAYERVSLAGLPIVARRRVRLGPIDPATARRLLIQHGLVERQWEREPKFLAHNGQVLAEIERLEDKLRRRDLTPNEETLFEFYDRQVPNDVYDGPRLLEWLQREETENPKTLRLNVDDLLRDSKATARKADYPDRAQVASTSVSLEYHFQPGEDLDGVTVAVPLEVLRQLDPLCLGWLVPGMLEQKITALIKSLPKPIRRNLVPAPDSARRALKELRFGDGDLLQQLARVLGRIAGQPIAASAFDVTGLPKELVMNVRVVNDAGETLGTGHDVHQLCRELADQAATQVADLQDSRFSREGITTWDFGELPQSVEVKSRGRAFRAYPMLTDRGESTALGLAETVERAEHETRRGVRRLFVLASRRDLTAQLGWLPKIQEMRLWSASISGFQVDRQLVDLIAERAFLASQPIPRTEDQFRRQLKAGKASIGPAVQDVASLVPEVLGAQQRVRRALQKWKGSRCQYAFDDVRKQLAFLMAPEFLSETPWPWLQQFPRYLRAIEYRLDKLQGGGEARDRSGCEEILRWWRLYREYVDEHPMTEYRIPRLTEFRWLLEEYRVSLFAQPLGTAVRVSAKRLEQHWQSVLDGSA